ncbi:MAG: T9SS type A sorting domain-containing protein [Vicingaceae bacterium]|nr:T9SS type A sorting domain-containing protein [Vicingaceae bacterium]
MKKYITIAIALLITSTVSSQVKHNKFTTRVMFDQFNPGNQFWETGITEIKDNSGYFLSNRLDNTGAFNPSLVKLDVDGNIVFDTIYDFIPNNLGGFLHFKGASTNSTSHTMLYRTGYLQSQMSLAAPYFINTDFSGNVNWHVGFSHDTLDLEAEKIINTQDGGYLVCGTLYDWFNVVYVPSGFAIKVDNMGVMQWQQFYAEKDSMEIHFRDGIETPDGGFLFVGDAPNFQGGAKTPTPGSMDILIDLVKTDNLGNVQWSKAMNLDYPVDQQYGFGDFSVAMLDDTNAFVSYSAYDTTGGGYDAFIITNVNVNNGINNWSKIYSLAAGGDIRIRKSIATSNGEIVVSASDYSGNGTGALFMIDGNGNFNQSKRFTYWNHSNFPYNTINTIDGGFVHVSEVDPNEVLVVKTDKFFDPSCSDVDSLYGGLNVNMIADSSYFGVIDSTYMLSNLNMVQLLPGSPVETSTDDSLICSCSNTITGTVLDGVTPVNGAKVFLFKKGIVPKPWAPIDSMVTGVAGTYMFNYVPTDSFLVKVEPSPIFNPNSMISYHKHLDTCYKWESAGVFYAHCDSGSVVKDVTLITPPPLTGNSSLNGYVFEYSGSFNKSPGDPIPNIDITVEQSPGGIVGGSTSGGNGYYDLSNINASATYIVSIDYPGLPHDSIWTVAVNFNDSILDSLNFYIDSTGIYILVEPLGTGISVANEPNLEFELYPNPTNGPATLMIDAIKPKDIYIDITNEVGKIISTRNERVNSGVNKISLNTAILSSGIYFVKVREKGKLYVRKLIKY